MKQTVIELATNSKGKGSVGAVDCTADKDLCQRCAGQTREQHSHPQNWALRKRRPAATVRDTPGRQQAGGLGFTPSRRWLCWRLPSRPRTRPPCRAPPAPAPPRFGVTGYPTFKKFGADKDKPEEYEGNRSIQDMFHFLTGVKENVDDFYGDSGGCAALGGGAG